MTLEGRVRVGRTRGRRRTSTGCTGVAGRAAVEVFGMTGVETFGARTTTPEVEPGAVTTIPPPGGAGTASAAAVVGCATGGGATGGCGTGGCGTDGCATGVTSDGDGALAGAVAETTGVETDGGTEAIAGAGCATCAGRSDSGST